jgi:hypothetical protein
MGGGLWRPDGLQARQRPDGPAADAHAVPPLAADLLAAIGVAICRGVVRHDAAFSQPERVT